MIWMVNRYSDEGNEGRSKAVPTDVILETDAVAFRATFVAGTRISSANTVIGYDTSWFSESREVVLSVSTDRYHQQLPEKIYGTELEVGISGMRLEANIENAFGGALASGSFLTDQAARKAPPSLGLNGTDRAARKFIADCKAIFAAIPQQQITQPQKPEPRMPRRQSSGIHGRGSPPVNQHMESNLR